MLGEVDPDPVPEVERPGAAGGAPVEVDLAPGDGEATGVEEDFTLISEFDPRTAQSMNELRVEISVGVR